MATLQLPANNLANLANLPPGTKLYLTTNSKNPSGKGKLLLIPQGAILRASGASETPNSFSSSFFKHQNPLLFIHSRRAVLPLCVLSCIIRHAAVELLE